MGRFRSFIRARVGARLVRCSAVVVFAGWLCLLPASAPRAEEAVALTLVEAVEAALEGNLDVRVAAYDPLRLREAEKSAASVYDPALFSTFSLSRSARPVQSVLDTGTTEQTSLIESRSTFQAGLKKLFSTGTQYSMSEAANHLLSNSTLVTPNPQYTSSVTFQVIQPLLLNLGDPAGRAAIRIARINTAISEEELRRQALDVAVEVARAYWQLVFDRDVVRINAETLAVTEQLLGRELVRFEKGLSKQLDVDRAGAAVESRRGDLLRARNRVRVTTQQLRLLLGRAFLPVAGETELIPSDAPYGDPLVVDEAAAIATALARRPEIERVRKAAESGGIRRRLASHRRLPKLDARASYTMNGLTTEYWRAWGEAWDSDDDAWSVGVEFEWPIGSGGPRAEHRRAVLEERQLRQDMDRVRDQVIQDVRVAVLGIRLSWDEYRSALLTVELARGVVRGENVRFELGQTTNEELLRAQDLLAGAEREAARALAGYNIGIMGLARARGTLFSDLGIE